MLKKRTAISALFQHWTPRWKCPFLKLTLPFWKPGQKTVMKNATDAFALQDDVGMPEMMVVFALQDDDVGMPEMMVVFALQDDVGMAEMMVVFALQDDDAGMPEMMVVFALQDDAGMPEMMVAFALQDDVGMPEMMVVFALQDDDVGMPETRMLRLPVTSPAEMYTEPEQPDGGCRRVRGGQSISGWPGVGGGGRSRHSYVFRNTVGVTWHGGGHVTHWQSCGAVMVNFWWCHTATVVWHIDCQSRSCDATTVMGYSDGHKSHDTLTVTWNSNGYVTQWRSCDSATVIISLS